MTTIPIAVASIMKLPDNVAFSLFGLDVYWFGLLLAVGVLAAIWLTYLECRRKELPADTAIDLCLVALPCGIIGARLVYVLLHLSRFKGRALQALYLWDGGLSVAGGIVCALIGLFIYARKKHIRFLKLLDTLAPGVTAALAIGAWGHFFNQDFYGPLVTNGALKWFPLCVRLEDGGIHLALFFYLFVFLALVFVYLWFRLRKRAKHDGDVSFAFLLLAGLAYAVLFALRRDGSGNYLIGQITGSVLFLACLLFLLVRSIRENRLGRLIWPAPEEASSGEDADEACDASKAVENGSKAETDASSEDDAPAEDDASIEEDASAGDETKPEEETKPEG